MANASLNPEEFQEGGGLIDDVDVDVTSMRFEMFDYQGKADPTPALRLVGVADNGGEEVEIDQYYSAGSAADWKPSKDGKQLMSIGKATGIRMTSNLGILLKSLVESGFPADKLGDDISVCDGMNVHMVQVPEPTRKGLTKTPEQEEREKKFGPRTILVVSAINRLPWDKKAPKGAGKKTTAKKSAAKKAPASDDAVVEKLDALLLGVLEEEGAVEKKTIAPTILKLAKEDDDRNAMLKMCVNEDYLAGEDRPWTFADGTLVPE